MTALAIAIFIIVAIIGLALAFLGWRKWRVVDPLNTAPRTPIILIIGLVMLAVGTVGVGVIFLKQGVFIPGGEWPEAQAPKPFSIIATSPADGATVSRNAIIQIFFNRPVKQTDAFVRVSLKGEQGEVQPIPGSVVILNEPEGGNSEIKSIMVFRALLPCGEAAKKENCFEEEKEYEVELQGNKIHTLKGDETLSCSGSSLCKFTFITGKDIDKAEPKVKFAEDLLLPASKDASVYLSAEDDFGIAYTRLTLDKMQSKSKYLGVVAGSLDDKRPIAVDVADIAAPSHHFITAESYDIAGRRSEVSSVVGIYQSRCFNKTQDEKEIGIDCGGPDCPACE